ncbi:MAG: type II toxin-antitoxin system HicB family antitoxin [Armatimonadetes bacterium]|nr:type II toxin-antitoxin system HicB family antitoxin [Armatimonadota bacterium]
MDPHEQRACRHKVMVLPDPDGDGYLAEVPAFPGVCAGGDTPAEALECAYEGIASILDSMARHGDPVPPLPEPVSAP